MDYVTIKIYRETRRLLRLIAAANGEQMVEVLARLCLDEARRLNLSAQIDGGSTERTTERGPGDDSVITD